jgi:hypothetical protein
MPALDRERRDALAPPGARGLGPERRAARLDVSGADDDAPRAIAQTEAEQPHLAASPSALAAARLDKPGICETIKFAPPSPLLSPAEAAPRVGRLNSVERFYGDNSRNITIRDL